ncbi:hypothetical protein EBZ38_13300 [bacterium]|nr:hypothetical protein [bacterium]
MEWLVSIGSKKFFVLTVSEELIDSEEVAPREARFEIESVYLIDDVDGQEILYEPTLKEQEQIENEIGNQFLDMYKSGINYH